MSVTDASVQDALPPHAAMEQAAQWFALLSSGVATPADQASWRGWLEGHQDHRRAWSYVESVSRRFAPMQEQPDPRTAAAVLQRARTQHRPRRRALALLAGVGVLGWAAWRVPAVRDTALAMTADYRSPTGATRLVRLADGTQVWLNSASALDVDYRAGLRRLTLVAGEILVDTAKDDRPLVVDTPQGRLRALGTRFTVRQETDATLLAVYQGAVEVRTGSGEALQVVDAGRQLRFTHDRIGNSASADPAREAWTRGILLARDIALADVIRELGRHRRGHLSLDPAVADLRVYGGFPLHDTDQTLALLADVLPIRIRHPLPWWTSIDARP